MRSELPKHLHPLLGRRLVDWVIEAVRPLEPVPFVVVCSPQTEENLRGTFPEGVELAVQLEPRGTGDAAASARAALGDFAGDVLVLSGDTPLLTPTLLETLLERHRREEAAVTIVSFERLEPGTYGRVIRDGDGMLRAIVEAPDASPEQLAITEVNSSIYVFDADALWSALERLQPDNAQGELYLTDAVRHLVAEGRRAAMEVAPDGVEAEGVNTRVELAAAGAVLRERIAVHHMLAGVTIVDPATTWIEPSVEIEPDAVIQPFTILGGGSVIRRGAAVGPHAVVVDADVGAGALVGPFCYLRPGSVLEEEAKAGTFVEIKNSRLGKGTKVPHQSYIGDADIGDGTNIAAGNITVNYPHQPDRSKGRTTIGRNVRTGVHNAFVAPVTIGDDAWVAAGSTITEDVPARALAIARARQVVKEEHVGKRDE
jgi:bifunctional UDP-N-acetylglucosamine pyrophosphorylase / glucosamine-1-phosphate N-acetyltransferase